MRRPTRTRRLLIAAIVSLIAFVTVSASGVRSFWNWDEWDFGGYVLSVGLKSGCVHAVHVSNSQSTISLRQCGHQSGDIAPEDRNFGQALTGFGAQRNILSLRVGDETIQKFDLPLWPLLFLLLIPPVRWLIARPANAPAFPVLTDAKRA